MRVGPENCLACEADNSGLLAPRPLEGLALDRRGGFKGGGEKGVARGVLLEVLGWESKRKVPGN